VFTEVQSPVAAMIPQIKDEVFTVDLTSEY